MIPEKAALMSKAMQDDERQESRAMRIWRTLEVQEAVSWQWQVAIFVAALIAIFTRLPGALLHPQFFAEDGYAWYQQAYNLGWLRSLPITQAGCVQMLPRLVTGLTLLFPMQFAPLIMNIGGAIVQVLPVTALLSRRCTPWGPLPTRMLMAVLYIVLPNAPEIHIVLTNAMWHLAVLEVLLAFSVPPISWRGRLTDILLFGIGAISGPFCLILIFPVAAYYWMRRQNWTLVVLGILFVGVVVQIFSLVHSVRNASPQPLGATPLSLLRIVAGDIFIDSMKGGFGAFWRTWWLAIAAIGGLTVMIWGWRSAPLAGRLYIIFAVLALMASLKDPLVGGNAPRWETLANIPGVRYWYLPSLMFLWAAAWCVGGGKSLLVRYAGISVLLLTTIGARRTWPYPPYLPEINFSAEVARFRMLKSGQHMQFPLIDPAGTKMELIKH
jgi:hypothetical protein